MVNDDFYQKLKLMSRAITENALDNIEKGIEMRLVLIVNILEQINGLNSNNSLLSSNEKFINYFEGFVFSELYQKLISQCASIFGEEGNITESEKDKLYIMLFKETFKALENRYNKLIDKATEKILEIKDMFGDTNLN